ncbi:MAG: hypothetical protein NVS4B8_28640 [Herpetosiphon sp.]
MLVVPWGFDQFFTGTQIAHLGAGQWLSRKVYQQPRVTQALDILLHKPSCHVRTRELAEVIGQEDGVGTFCAKLESVL